MIFIEKPPLWFWHLDGVDTGALRCVGDAWCAFGEFDLRGAVWSNSFFAERPSTLATWPSSTYGKFASGPRAYENVVHVTDHLRRETFVADKVSSHIPAGTYMRPMPDNSFRARYEPPDDDTFHECYSCGLARSCGHPMDPVKLCKGCQHNKEVIERLNQRLEDY